MCLLNKYPIQNCTNIYLFGEQLFTQCVQGDEFASKQTSFKETFSHQHDLTNQLKVRHHHSAGSEHKQKIVIQRLLTAMGFSRERLITQEWKVPLGTQTVPIKTGAGGIQF